MVAVVGDAATFVREGFDGKGQRLLLAELFALLASQGCIQTGLKIGASITDCQRVCLGVKIALLIVYSKAKFDNLPLSVLQQLREELNNGR